MSGGLRWLSLWPQEFLSVQDSALGDDVDCTIDRVQMYFPQQLWR